MPKSDLPDVLRGISGLLDDADIVVKKATAGENSDYQDGEVCIITLDVEDDDGEEQNIFLSVGSGREAKEKGRVLVVEKTGEPSPKGLQKSSNAYKFMASIIATGGADELVKRLDEFENGPQDMGFWEGLKLHVGRVTDTNFTTGAEYERLVCTEFLGVDGEGRAKKAPAKAAGKKAAPKKDEEADEIPTVMMVKLKKAAKDADDHNEFIEAAMEIAGVSDNEAAMALVADEAFFEEFGG